MRALRQAAALAAGAVVAGTLTACTHHAVPCGNAAGATLGFRSDDGASAWITVPRPYDECPQLTSGYPRE